MRRWLRPALLALLLVVTAEGVTRIVALERAASTTTPYRDFIAQVRAYIPPGSRVLGLQHYWFGLDDLDYRTWTVPLLQADPRHWSPPLSMAQALDNIAPDVVLIDSRIGINVDGEPATDTRARDTREWLDRRGYKRVAVVRDLTYGDMAIYQVRR